MLRPGDEFVPGYRLEKKLGRGAFGEVWRASAPGRTSTALKFIAMEGKNGLKEYRAIQRVKEIRHANLLPITALWLLDEQDEILADDLLDAMPLKQNPVATGRKPAMLVVAMLLGDGNLAERLEQHQDGGAAGYPIAELLDCLEDAAKGIDYLNSPKHDLGSGPVAIQHCDIKPQNIVLVGGSALVCDFGLARVLSSSRMTSGVAGTPAYIAPEMIEKGVPSAATDQYSLAITYYELRTGKLPFEADNVSSVMNIHLQGHLRFTEILPGEEQVLRRATARKPEDRYGGTREMMRALRSVLESSSNTGLPAASSKTDGARVAPAMQATPLLAGTLNLPIEAASSQELAERETDAQTSMLAETLRVPDAAPKSNAPRSSAPATPDKGNARSAKDPAGWRTKPPGSQSYGRQIALACLLILPLMGLGVWQIWFANRPSSTAQASFNKSAQGTESTAGTGTGTLRGSEQTVASPPRLKIPKLEPLTLEPGEERVVELNLAAENIEGPVAIEWAGFPTGVTVAEDDLDAVPSKRSLKIKAAPNAAPVTGVVRVVARAGKVTAATALSLTIESAALGELARFTADEREGLIHTQLLPQSQRVLGVGERGSVQTWDLASQKRETHFVHPGLWLTAAQVTSDGAHILCAGEANPFILGQETFDVRELSTGKLLRTLPGHTRWVSAVALSPTGRLAATGSADGAVKLWDWNAGREAGELAGHSGRVHGLAFSPDGARLASCAADGVRLFDVESRRQLRFAENGSMWQEQSVAFSPDGQAILSADGPRGLEGRGGRMMVWRVDDGPNLGNSDRYPAGIGCAVFLPDGKRILAGGEDGTVRVWDYVRNEEQACFQDHRGAVTSLAILPGGRKALSSSLDGTIRLWGLPRAEKP